MSGPGGNIYQICFFFCSFLFFWGGHSEFAKYYVIVLTENDWSPDKKQNKTKKTINALSDITKGQKLKHVQNFFGLFNCSTFKVIVK